MLHLDPLERRTPQLPRPRFGAGDRVAPVELLPLELHSIQELNYQVGEFFDRALFHLTRGYEAEAARHVHESMPA